MFLDPPPTRVVVLTSADTCDLYNLFPVKSASIKLYTLHYSTDRYTQGGHEFVAVIGTQEMGCVVAHEDSLNTFYSSLDRNRIPEGDDKALTRI